MRHGTGHPDLDSPLDAWQAAQERAAATGTDDQGGVPEPARSELLADEIALATADSACDESAGLGAARDAAVERLQAEFVEQHRAELDAWRDGCS